MGDKRVSVVIADDHPLVVAGLHKALAQAGIEVIGTASDASELMALLRRSECDVVVTDYAMPRGGVFDGWRLLASLESECPTVPAIVYSDIADPFLVGSLMQCGVAGIVSKRDDLQEMSNAVVALARGEQYHSPTMQRALDQFSVRPDLKCFARLSRREMVVAGLVLCGLSTAEAARILKCSPETISGQWQAACERLGFGDASEFHRFAEEHGLCLDFSNDGHCAYGEQGWLEHLG
jgi:two-component system, NarL family, captular synthesis response regulator RcsB